MDTIGISWYYIPLSLSRGLTLKGVPPEVFSHEVCHKPQKDVRISHGV